MKKLALAGALAFALSGCTGAAILAAVPVVVELYGAGKATYCQNVTDEGREKVKGTLTDGETVYRYCPGDK